MIGGAFGAFLVATQGLTVGTIGVALFSIAVTAGQSTSALLVDHIGLGPSGHQPLSVPRLIAATFAIAAVVLAAGERLVESFGWLTAFFALLPLLAGAGTAVQQALNGRLSAVGGPWATTLNNFIVGTSVLVVCFALSLLAGGHLDALPSSPVLYAGGVIGVGFIWLAAALVKVHGVLVLGLSMIAGNVIGAEFLELVGGQARIGWVGAGAGALTVLGVLIAVLVRPRSPVRTG
jgi:transporter family-2 protein